MLKQSLIPSKQAEKLIFDMVRHADHLSHNKVKNYTDKDIQYWFELNKYPWNDLVENARKSESIIPLVENLIGYEFSFENSHYDNYSNISVYHEGHEMAKLVGPGQISMKDYHTKYIEALRLREQAIQKKSYSALLSAVTNGIAAIESYITIKANLWNKWLGQMKFKIEISSNLDEKLNNWLFDMTGIKLNQIGAAWNHFKDFQAINNEIMKHNISGSHTSSYNEMANIINKFRTGIATILFRLHLAFEEPVPSKIIRGMYLPEVIYSSV